MIYAIVKICASDDSNGNPRRGWVVSRVDGAGTYKLDSSNGSFVEFIDEGYQGDRELRERYPEAIFLGSFNVTPAEYRAAKKQYR